MRQSRFYKNGFSREVAGGRHLDFRIEVVPERDTVRVCPMGEIDLETAGGVRAELEGLKSAGFKRLVLDLRGTTFIDTTGLRLVLEADATSAADGFDFAVFPGPPAVQRAFDVAGLSSQLPFVDSFTGMAPKVAAWY